MLREEEEPREAQQIDSNEPPASLEEWVSAVKKTFPGAEECDDPSEHCVPYEGSAWSKVPGLAGKKTRKETIQEAEKKEDFSAL